MSPSKRSPLGAFLTVPKLNQWNGEREIYSTENNATKILQPGLLNSTATGSALFPRDF